MSDFRYTSTILDSGSYYTNLASNSSEPLEMPGIEREIMTAYGPAKVRYGQCTQAGGCARGELQSFAAPVTITNLTSGSTTTAVTTGLTANDYKYDILVVKDNDSSAGASPEGFPSPILSNTTTTIYLDPSNPLPAALEVNDDVFIVSFCKCIDAAASDEVNDIFGVAAADISHDYWGWFFFDGICPYALRRATTALTADKALIAHTARVSISNASGDQLLIGTTLGRVAYQNDSVDDVCIVKLWNLGQARGVSA